MGGTTGDIFDVDDLFFRLSEGVGLKVAHLLQPVAVITASIQQTGGVRVIQRLPPQAEEQAAVFHLGFELLEAGDVDLRGLILRVGCKVQGGESI